MVSKISSTIGSPLYELLQCRIDWEDGGAGQSRSRADLVQDQIIIAIPDFSFDQNKIDRGQAKLTLKEAQYRQKIPSFAKLIFPTHCLSPEFRRCFRLLQFLPSVNDLVCEYSK